MNYLRWPAAQGVATARHGAHAHPQEEQSSAVIGEIKQNAANRDNRKVFNILGLLREYDAKSKGMNAGVHRTANCCANCCSKIFMPDAAEVYLYQTVHVSTKCSACGNTWPYSTAGRASSGARGHRTPGGRDGRRGGGRMEAPAATVRNSCACPAGIGPAAGIRWKAFDSTAATTCAARCPKP